MKNLENSSEEAKKGRDGDTYTAHLTEGEVVVPAPMLSQEDMDKLFQLLRDNGIDPEQVTVGDAENHINGMTGHPEFGFFSSIFKSIKNIVKNPSTLLSLAAAIAMPALAPGLVGSLGLTPAMIGAGTGALAGGLGIGPGKGGIMSALQGGLTGYGAGSLGSGLFGMGSALNSGATLGDAFAEGFPTISNLGSNIKSGIGSLFSPAGEASVASSIPAGTSIDLGSIGYNSPQAMQSALASGQISPMMTEAGKNYAQIAANAGGGASQSFGNFLNSGSTLTDTAGLAQGAASVGGGGASSLGSSIGDMFSGAGKFMPIISGIGNASALEDQNDIMQGAFQQNQKALAPYLGTGNIGNAQYQSLLTNPSLALQSNPAYQFQLEQGNNALNNQLSASGMLDSGAALKAAQEFGQGLANTTYQNALNNASNAAGFGANMNLQNAGLVNNAANASATNNQAQMTNLLTSLGQLFGTQKSNTSKE